MARLGTMIEKKINSSFLNEEKMVKVYLPENFDFTYETKLCFMQDGDDYFQLGRIATVSDRLHSEGALNNTVFIGIHYMNREDRLKKYHPDGYEFDRYQHFLIKEVLPVVDDVIPLNPLGTARSLMGDSLAGTFAILTALDFPNIFKQVIMQSPLIDDTVMSRMKAADDPQLSIYHSIGLDETNVKTTAGEYLNFVISNQEASNYLDSIITDYNYSEIALGNHTWKHWQNELPETLEDMLG